MTVEIEVLSEIGMDSKIQIITESKKDLLPGTFDCCIDDRFLHKFEGEIPEDLKEVIIETESQLGMQVPGGTLEFMAILAETATDGDEFDFDKLFDILKETHELAGFKMGVHMDNDHDELSDEEIFTLLRNAIKDPQAVPLKGCGFGAFLSMDQNPLSLKERSLSFFKSINVISMMVSRGVRIAELAGHHANQKDNEALAVTNKTPGTTLDQGKLAQMGIKVYGHDEDAIDNMIEIMAQVVEVKGDSAWAENIRRDGVKIERAHHLAAIRALTGMDEPVEI